MVNMKFPLTADKINQIIVVDELLSANDKYNANDAEKFGREWSGFKLTENRFSLYYRRRVKGLNADFDIGLMHQYWREVKQSEFTNSVNVMLDLIIYNPFSRKKNEINVE